MNQHYEISSEKVEEVYKYVLEQKQRWNSIYVEEKQEDPAKKIEHLCTDKYDVLYDISLWHEAAYHITEKEKNKEGQKSIIVSIFNKELQPNSVRERLHNIQAAKEFYEQIRTPQQR